MVREACRDEKSGMRIPASGAPPPYYSGQEESGRAEKGSKERRTFRRVKSTLYIEIVGLGAARTAGRALLKGAKTTPTGFLRRYCFGEWAENGQKRRILGFLT